jgi:hypothetical protein
MLYPPHHFRAGASHLTLSDVSTPARASLSSATCRKLFGFGDPLSREAAIGPASADTVV